MLSQPRRPPPVAEQPAVAGAAERSGVAQRGRLRASLQLAAGLAVLAAPLLAQDLVVLRSGEQRKGALSACVGDRCMLDGKALARAEITWIGLGTSDAAPPASRRRGEDELWLVDGGTRQGVFAGLSLGEVVFGGEPFERAAVRWIGLAAPGLEPGAGDLAAAPDVLIRRDGAVATGELAGCSAHGCTLGGTTSPREELAWIGIGIEPGTPPPAAVPDAAQDAVQLAGGALRTAPLIGIDATTVTTARGAHPRAEVDWIYLAPPERGTGFGPGRERDPPPPERPPVQDPPPPPPPPVADSPPLPPPGDSSAPPLGERGGLWSGTVQGRYWSDDGYIFHANTITAQFRAREYLQPPTMWNGRPVHRGIMLYSEGSTVTESVERQEKFAGGERCSGHGSTSIPDAPTGWIHVKLHDHDLTPLLGFDLPAGASSYRVALWSPVGVNYRRDCHADAGSWSAEESFLAVFPIGRDPHPDQQPPFPHDAEVRHLADGRMVGSYSRSYAHQHVTLSWSICREGVACAPPAGAPAPPASGPQAPPATPCEETATDQALLDVRVDQWKALAEALRAASGEYDRLQQQASQWSGDFEQAMRNCDLWDTAFVLIGLGTSGLAGPNQPKGFTELVNFFDLVDKVTSNDPSWALPNPDLASGWISVEDAWDVFGLAWNDLGPSAAPEALRARLRTCGAPTLEAVLDGAYEYLRLIDEVKPLADRTHELSNRMRDTEEQIFDFCLSHPQACEDYQRCQ